MSAIISMRYGATDYEDWDVASEHTSGVDSINAQMLFDERSRMKESLINIVFVSSFFLMNEERDVSWYLLSHEWQIVSTTDCRTWSLLILLLGCCCCMRCQNIKSKHEDFQLAMSTSCQKNFIHVNRLRNEEFLGNYSHSRKTCLFG